MYIFLTGCAYAPTHPTPLITAQITSIGGKGPIPRSVETDTRSGDGDGAFVSVPLNLKFKL